MVDISGIARFDLSTPPDAKIYTRHTFAYSR
jgi:hypothetical protein